MSTVPQPYPQEFGDDVLKGARNREPGQTVKQSASDFGIAESCLGNWMRQADVQAGARPGTTAAKIAELREAKKRLRLLEPENEVLRRAAAYLSPGNLPGRGVPARSRAGPGRDPRHGEVPGPQARSPAFIPLARHPGYRGGTGTGLPRQRPVRCPHRGPGVRLRLPGPGGPRRR